MRIALVQARNSDGNTFLPPLGLAYIAALLEQNGHDVKIIDIDPEIRNPLPQLLDFEPRIIGFTLMTTYYTKTDLVIRNIRKALPDSIICAGGIHASALPERTLKELGGGLDFVVKGEGEFVLSEVAEKLESNMNHTAVPGTVCLVDSQIIDNGPAPVIEDLDVLPFPARHLLDMEKYMTFPGVIRGVPLLGTTTMVTSRGCPGKCIYCSNHFLFKRRTHQRSVDNVIAEIESLVNTYKINGLGFTDDTLLHNSEWVKEFCYKLIDKKWDLKWACLARADQITDELAGLMRKAGCHQMEIGVESGSDRILKLMKKGLTSDQISKGYEIARQNDIRTTAPCIIGFPTETEEEMRITARFAQSLKPNFTHFFFLTPFPGSEIYEMALKNGWIPKNHQFGEDWDIRSNAKPAMAIEYTPEQLVKIRSHLQNSFFFRNYSSFFRNFFTAMSLRFSIALFLSSLLSPREIIKSILLVVKTGRFDHLAESMLRAYRYRLER